MPRSTAEVFAQRQQSRNQQRRQAAWEKRNRAMIRAQEATARSIESQTERYMAELMRPMNALPLWQRCRLAWDLIRGRFCAAGEASR